MTTIAVESLKPQTSELKLKHPVTGETNFTVGSKTDVEGILILCSKYSDEYVEAIKHMAQDFEEKQNSKVDVGYVNKLTSDMWSKCIVGWVDNGFFTDPYTKEGAMILLNNSENSWVIEQITTHIQDDSNFFLIK